MKSEERIKKASKRLSWLLRHGANEAGLAMDKAGFALLDDVLRLGRIDRADIGEIIRENNKARYELSADGLRLRACQGHSLSGTPVTREGLESTWAIVDREGLVFHGTAVASTRAILSPGPDGGIQPGARTHVHLAEAEDSVVGKRAGVDVLLAVSLARMRSRDLAVWRAPNGVLLAREVPYAAIVEVRAMNRPGERAAAELQALLAAASAG